MRDISEVDYVWVSRKSRSKKGSNGIADQILQNAPERCRVRIISEGKEVNQQMLTTMSSPSPRVNSNDHHIDDHQTQTPMPMKEDQDHHQNGPVSCNCFKPMFK